MISFYINGEAVEVQLEGEETIGDVLKSFEITCEENSAAVIGITVDGTPVTAETFDTEAGKPLSANTKFEFSVVQKIQLNNHLQLFRSFFLNYLSRWKMFLLPFRVEKIKKLASLLKRLQTA